MSIAKKKVRTWFEIHKWTSLICTLFLLMLCLTGLPLIFFDEINALTGKEAQAPALPEGTPRMKIDDIITRAKAVYPTNVIRYVYWQEEHPNIVTVSMADSLNAAADVSNLVVLDERTGQVLKQPTFDEGVMYIVYKLHVDMFAGIPGKLFLGVMGILFVLAIISGIMLYSPVMRKYEFGMVRTKKSTRLQWLDMHNMLGVVTLSWALVVGITGVINTASDIVLGLWQRGQLSEMVAPYRNAPPLKSELSSLEGALTTAIKAAPDMHVSIVAYPGTVFTSLHHYAVFMRGNSALTARLIKPALIDAANGSLTDMRTMPWYVNALFLSQPLHFGNYGGMPLKILWAAFDLITIIVLITGLYLWFSRQKAREEQLARFETLQGRTSEKLLL